ncbi:MAG TPA: type IV toxin-antitoxin system AbiEi family antitoxin domain-containing protein [Pirellulales bacterium]|nr:type IV toxin-antitoxin system AbiEi family antitoxin domain-containing protein [Pirellulales bacterium]
MVRHNLTNDAGQKREQILTLARKNGLLRPRDLEPLGIAPEYLNKLYVEGILERPGRGLYRLAKAKSGRFAQLAEVAKRTPQAVVCLLSALAFHGLTTENPHEIWLAIPKKSRPPKIEYPPLRIVRYADAAQRFGIQVHPLDGVQVKIYSPAKTVADCFKFRNQVGLDVALEALRDCWRKKLATGDELWKAAKVCRMTHVIRPYMEAVI